MNSVEIGITYYKNMLTQCNYGQGHYDPELLEILNDSKVAKGDDTMYSVFERTTNSPAGEVHVVAVVKKGVNKKGDAVLLATPIVFTPQAQFQSVQGLGRSSPDAVRVECVYYVCPCTVVSCAKDA